MGRVMTIGQALQVIRERNVFLCFDERLGVDLWAPHTPVAPLAVRQAVYYHREAIKEKMDRGEADVCPTPLHRKYHRRAGRRGPKICQMCLRLNGSMETAERQEAS